MSKNRYKTARRLLRWAGIFIAFSLLLTACLAVGITTASAREVSRIEIPHADKKITIDGVASEGEYAVSYTMDKTTATPWIGTLERSSVTWRLAWDETGLYVCATVKDSTPVYRHPETHWVGADCVEFGLNPGYILEKDDDKGVFFSMGAMENGRVIVYRHNYDERLVSDEILGMATGHEQGSHSYTIEVCIPWSLIFIKADCTKTSTHLDATRLTAGEDLAMGMVMASIDAADDTNISVAYKFNGTDFVTGQYIPGLLTAPETETTPATEAQTEVLTEAQTEVRTELQTDMQAPAETQADTQVETQAETQAETETDSDQPIETETCPVTQPETDAPAQSRGCASTVGVMGVWAVLGMGVALCRKKKH